MMSFHLPFSWLVDTSLRVSSAIILLMLLRPLLRRWVGSGGVALLWLAVAARLLLPGPVESRWSVWNCWPARATAHAHVENDSVKVRVMMQPINELRPQSLSGAQPPIKKAARRSMVQTWNAWNIFWLIGAASGITHLLYRWRQTRRWAKQTFPGSDDPRLAETFAALPEAHRRGVELRITDSLPTPTLAGIIHPQIWMPRAWLDRLTIEELQHVLLHELGHARRRDLLAQWVCALACSLHWFNPLVWWMAKMARADRELACDAWVLAHGDATGTTVANYGNTLIKVVQWLRDPEFCMSSPAAVTMAASKRGLSLRVREIGEFRGDSGWKRLVAGLGVAMIGLLAMTSRDSSAQEKVESSTNATVAPSATPTPEVAAPTGDDKPTDASIPASSAPTVEPTQTPSASNQPFQVEIEAKIIGLTRQAVERLKAQTAQDPDDSGLIDQLAASYAPKSGADASNPSQGVQMASRILTPTQLQTIVRRLNEHGADLFSAPRVTTKSGQKATIEIVREFMYPTKLDRSAPSGPPIVANFEKKNLGVTLTVEPNISPDDKLIDLSISWQQVFLQGFMDPKAGRLISVQQSAQPGAIATQPMFSTQMIDAMVTLSPDQTVVLSGPRWDPALWGEIIDRGNGKRDDNEELLLNFLTVHLIEPNGLGPLTQEQFDARMNRLQQLIKEKPEQKGMLEENMEELRKRYEKGKALEIEDTVASSETPPQSSDANAPKDRSAAPSGATPSPAAAPARTDYPYATPVPGKSGYIISPYAPNSGYIDVRGYSSGAEVKDPYTNKTILIP